MAVSTLQSAALKALLKKLGPDLGEIVTSASAVSPAAFATVGTANANSNMNTAIAELKSFIILSCQNVLPAWAGASPRNTLRQSIPK
jgi:hypothetical protein